MKKIFLFLLLLISFNTIAQLKINEIMTNNVSAVMDYSYNYSMWVELYNSSTTTTYNQANFYFTDDLQEPRKWKPNTTSIAAGSFSLLWFERDDRFGHANFKLNPQGGALYLMDGNGQIVDFVIYPAQYRNISYGRKTNGAMEWVFFEQHSAGASNNGKVFSYERCSNPVFNLEGGFYSSAQDLTFATPAAGEKIYYTINGSEPTVNSYIYTPGFPVTLRTTSVIRAKTFSSNKLSSDIVSSTYFINERRFNLPVVSIITEQANLTDNMIGIYCDGTNGITGNGQTSPKNYNQDWDRPVNYELYDTTGVRRLNQEVDICILGGWTRANGQKSIAIKPKHKFGDNRLRYDFFAATKPNRNYKDIQMRNSGNDFGGSMMRDAFMQSLIMKRMDLDYLAYEPSVIFINGVYFGIQNLRERSNSNFMYSNYGVDEDKVTWIEATNLGVDTPKDIATDPGFAQFSNFLKNNDMNNPEIYKQVCDMMDVDEFANYMVAQIFYANNDWPYNNVKMWKLTEGGKWRWILFDTDFGFGAVNHNTLTFALGENSDRIIGGYTTPPDWSTVVFRRLVTNDTFRNKFIDRASIHLSTTFETNRVNQIMDSLSAKISGEIVYHKSKWGGSSFSSVLSGMKSFAVNRPNNVLYFISNRFLGAAAIQNLKLSSNIDNASYTFNSEPVIDASLVLKSFKNRSVALKANPVPGYKFKQWEYVGASSVTTLLPMGTSWKYFDGNAMPAANWFSPTFSDAAWKTGNAPLGYGFTGVVTTIGYGTNANNKYPTAYFRKTVFLSNVASKTNFKITTFVDDGVAVYVNGTEVGRANMPAGTLAFSTLASSTNSGITSVFNVPASLLKDGNNLIAVEVHQGSVSSSDLVFDLQFTHETPTVTSVVTNPVLNTLLTADLDIRAVYEKWDDPNIDIVPDVVINEVVSSNNLISDEFAGKDDYIELYNNGTTDVNIAGWYLSDTPANRTLSQIPSTDAAKTTIPAKGRLILWADEQQIQGPLHLAFKLGKEGEPIMLSKTNSSGQLMLVDSVFYPVMEANLSYSRVPDGSSNWVVQATTFNKSNEMVAAVEIPAVDAVQIYPTLVANSITVRNAAGNILRVADLTGKTLLRADCRSDMEVVQLGNLQRGIYVVTVGASTFKIVKL